MATEKDIQEILSHLVSDEGYFNVVVDGSQISIHFTEDSSKLSLSTTVYNGGNYIPKSVRSSILHRSPINHLASIKTFLTVDEPHFQVNLNYLGRAQNGLSQTELKELLEEFRFLAEKWRDYLDENDRNDLVYVKVR